MLRRTFVTFMLLSLWTIPAVSAAEQQPERWSVNAYTGVNLIFPLLGASVGYQPADSPFEFGLSMNMNTLLNKHPSNPSLMPMATLYGKYYFSSDLKFRAFAQLDLGAGYVTYGPDAVTSPGVNVASGFTPTLMGGIGFDWMPWEHVGFTAALKTDYNQYLSFLYPGFMVRPELGLRFVW